MFKRDCFQDRNVMCVNLYRYRERGINAKTRGGFTYGLGNIPQYLNIKTMGKLHFEPLYF